MNKYAKLVNGSLVYATDLIQDGNDTVMNPTIEKLIELGYKLVVYATIIPPIKWFQKAQITYQETETEIKELYVVVAIDSIKSVCESHYNQICNQTILSGFYFEGRNLWLTAETQQNITTDYFDSVTLPEMQTYPKYYKFADGMVVFDNLDRLKLLFRTMKIFVADALGLCWMNKFQNLENPLEPLTDEQIYMLLLDRYVPEEI